MDRDQMQDDTDAGLRAWLADHPQEVAILLGV